MISLRNISQAVGTSGKTLLQPSKQIAVKTGRPLAWKPLPGATSAFFSSQRGLASTSDTRSGQPQTIELVTPTVPSARKQAPRGDYSKVESDDVSFFSNLLGKHRVLTNEAEIEGYNVDWLGAVKGQSRVVLRPRNTTEVSMIMSYCHERTLAVVPQGGNTGISGGCIAVHDEIIISTSLMNEIEQVDEWSGVLVCQSGCILDSLNEHLSDHELIVPLDLGAKQSCQIGGNVSTNAGGLRVLRYGSLHSSVTGLEVVLPDGTVLDLMNTMPKDNTGYHLKHLFIGSEGTLGIVTKVAIQCVTKPKAVHLAFLALDSFESVLATYRMAKRDLGEILSACEYFDRETLVAVEQNLDVHGPLQETYPFYMMIETAGSNGHHDEEKLTMFLQKAMDHQVVSDGTIAAQPSHVKTLWNIRERFPDALKKDGHLTVYDFSIPLESFNEMVEETRAHLGPLAKRVTGFGHLGDGNLHLNVTMDEFNPDLLSKAEPFVYNWVSQRKGSISSEHGLGSIKRDYIYHSKSPQAVHLMRELKRLIDPKGILNPYKVIPTRNS